MKTHQQYIKQISEINPNLNILGVYTGNRNKIEVQYKIDNYIWKPRADTLTTKKANGEYIGCPICGNKKISNHHKKELKNFIEELNLINPTLQLMSDYSNNRTNVKLKCKICNYEWNTVPKHIIRKNNPSSCPKCSRSFNDKNIEIGINDIYTLHPEIAQLAINQTLVKTLSSLSNREIEFQCPDCSQIFVAKVSKMCKTGFKCRFCDDNISFPEKVMLNLLNVANINYEYHKIFTWSQHKEYDFYLPETNSIVEMHGSQHYRKSGFKFRLLEEEQANDIFKEKLAKSNNIKNYIIIDSQKSELKYIKDNILLSRFAELYDINNIDWNIIEKYASRSLLKEVSLLWNQGYLTAYIADKLHLSRGTIVKYLKLATNLKLCKYKSNIHNRIICITTNELFDSKKEAQSYYYAPNLAKCNDYILKTGNKEWIKFNPEIHNINDYVHLE